MDLIASWRRQQEAKYLEGAQGFSAGLSARTRSRRSHPKNVPLRIAKVCGTSAVVARKVRQGERDAIVVWFEGTDEYRELDRIDFISLVVEKLEG